MGHLPLPHHLILTRWYPHEVNEAVQKSRAALLNNLASTSTSIHDLLNNLANVESLFLIHKMPEDNHQRIAYWSYADCNVGGNQAWEWGSRHMMLNLAEAEQQQRMAILTAAANLTGRAVHLLLNVWNLTATEERVWVEALSLAADRDAAPSSLFISLTSLHLHYVEVSEEFVAKLAKLLPSRSPLAASLQRLHINDLPIDWKRSTGFLRRWPKLKELSLIDSHREHMTDGEVMDFMDHLAPPKKGVETTRSIPPELYSLELGNFRGELHRSAIAAVVDALSRSGLPFFSLETFEDSAIETQLKSNQRNFLSGLDSMRVPATSMRLFI